MTIHSHARRPKVHHKRRPRRLSASERVFERFEDRYWNRRADQRLRESEGQERIPLEQVMRELGLQAD